MTKVVLCILDGFGWSDSKEHNAILQAKTTFFNKLFNGPKSLLNASGKEVGLPDGQVGNSEVGHMSIGAGRIIMQELTRIEEAIKTGSFHNIIKKVLNGAPRTRCHILGLISDGKVHASRDHLLLMANLLRDGHEVIIHAITDGRDSEITAGFEDIKHLDGYKVGTIHGRYYAMDRNNNLDRTTKSFNAIAHGVGHKIDNIEEYLVHNYALNIFDEYIEPAVIQEYSGINNGDIIFCTNYREDRARQIMHMLSEISGVQAIYSLTEYGDEFAGKVTPIFERKKVVQTLSEVASKAGLRQIKIAESEKYPHVTYFLNGGTEEALPLEERVLIPSPNVAKYDEKPEMSAKLVTEAVIQAMEEQYDLICVNYANADMVGHCGNYIATINAIESLDKYCNILAEKALSLGYELLITSDHGNAELCWKDNLPHTSHTTNLVPFFYIGKMNHKLRSKGSLVDIAPTIIKIVGLEQPNIMTGTSLVDAN